MRLTITPRQRALLLFVSASGYTAWFSGLGDRTSAAELGSVAQPFVTVDARPDLPSVASIIARDPFLGKPGPGAANATRSQSSAPADADSRIAMPSVPSPGDVVVPDIASRSGAPGDRLTLVLRATIVGPEPVAYVANGTAMDIVRVGDSLGDRRVAKIDLRGIAFADGTRLDLPDAYVATPEPRRRAADEDRISLEALRHLLLPARAQAQPNGPSAETTRPQTPSTPEQTASASAFPTPAPLPTVNMQGLPVGVNPTADPNGPTPYPNPYPYAPPVRH